MDERQARIEGIVATMRELETHGQGTGITKRMIMLVRRDFDQYQHLLDNDIIHKVLNDANGIVEDNTPAE